MNVKDPHNQTFDKPMINMYMGGWVNVFDLQPEDINPLDIAHALSQICRYTGHTDDFYSVGEHSIIVHDYMMSVGHTKQECRDGLMHDTDETYLVDLPSPIKHQINGFGDAFKAAAKEIQIAVSKRFDLTYPEPKIIKEYDVRLRENELTMLFPRLDERFRHFYGEPLPIKIKNWSPKKTEYEFLLRLKYHGIVKQDKKFWQSRLKGWQPT